MSAPYSHIEFPEAPEERPYVYINMVATIDGKVISGTRDEDVMDLGSKADHQAMARLDAASDGVLIGGRTLRASPRTWRPRARFHLVASRSGELPADARFLEGESYRIAIASSPNPIGEGQVPTIQGGDWPSVLRSLRGMGIEKLYVLGGSDLNGQLLERDLVDELFLTISPKVKLGTDVPTYAGGTPLPKGNLLDFELIESHIVADEVFLRYRRRRE